MPDRNHLVHEPPAAVAIGRAGLFLPFVLVFAAVAAFGDHSPGQIAASTLLLVFPLAILALRKVKTT